MHAVATARAWHLDMVLDGPRVGVRTSLTTIMDHIMEALRHHHTALRRSTHSIREILSTAMRDITDSKVASRCNPRRTHMILIVPENRSMRLHKDPHQLREDMEMESSDNRENSG
jgi:hypothetical protein